MAKPPRLTDGQRANFETLRRACKADDLALVSALRKDGTPVAVVCAMQTNDDETISPVPLAYLPADNPYEELQDPTADDDQPATPATPAPKAKYYTCPICEANFKSLDGRIPVHRYQRQRCAGSLQQGE